MVSNFYVDKVTTEYPSYEFLLTLTHTLDNPRWAVFGEFQGIKSDFYSDTLLRGGATHLLNKDFQIEADFQFNFKNTPSRVYLTLGASYRLDWHKKDEIIKDKNAETDELEGLENEENPDDELNDLDQEIEDLNKELYDLEGNPIEEEAKPKTTPRYNESFEDPEDLEALEKQKEENRNTYVDEFQQKVDAKQSKKDAKRARKEAKKEAKLQKKLEKEQLKAQNKTDKELEKISREENQINEEINGDLDATKTPDQETPKSRRAKKEEKPKKKKRIKRKKLSAEERDKELDDLDRQIKELELEFEDDSKKKRAKKEKKKKKKKEKRRTKDVNEVESLESE